MYYKIWGKKEWIFGISTGNIAYRSKQFLCFRVRLCLTVVLQYDIDLNFFYCNSMFAYTFTFPCVSNSIPKHY